MWRGLTELGNIFPLIPKRVYRALAYYFPLLCFINTLERHSITFKTQYNKTLSPGHETFVYYVVRNANS
jgi:hypothetical protein